MCDNESAPKPLLVIFFDANLPQEPLQNYLMRLQPHARLWFINEPNYFILHPDAFESVKGRFLSDIETMFLRNFFQTIATTRPAIMKDHALYLYVGMLAELFYPETPCVFFTGDRRSDKEIKKQKKNERSPVPPQTAPCNFPRVFRVIRALDKKGGAHDEFKIQPYESLRGFPEVLQYRFEKKEYQGVELRNIPIVQVGTHGSDIAHRIIAEQVIAYFNMTTNRAIVPDF